MEKKVRVGGGSSCPWKDVREFKLLGERRWFTRAIGLDPLSRPEIGTTEQWCEEQDLQRRASANDTNEFMLDVNSLRQ